MTKIRNITSSVPADRSVTLIEKKLVENGASHIMKNYSDGLLQGISFRKEINGVPIAYELPAKVEPVLQLLLKQYKRPTALQINSAREQAQRTAWKLIYEWVDLQMSMIALEQMKFEEIFLPKMIVAPGRTAFDVLQDSGFKALNQ